jgi:hypothetical protein
MWINRENQDMNHLEDVKRGRNCVLDSVGILLFIGHESTHSESGASYPLNSKAQTFDLIYQGSQRNGVRPGVIDW